MQDQPLKYASFRPRAFAFCFDYLIIAVYLLCLVGVALAVRPPLAGFRNPWHGELVGCFCVTLPVTLYFMVSEGYGSHATWGKRRLNLSVTDACGVGISMPRSALRNILKFVPWELAHEAIWRLRLDAGSGAIAGTVILAAAWALVFANLISLLLSRKHQTLYDWLAGTVVTEAGSQRTKHPRPDRSA
jgi:uncharacterized RDD family membrane protein YckC